MTGRWGGGGQNPDFRMTQFMGSPMVHVCRNSFMHTDTAYTYTHTVQLICIAQACRISSQGWVVGQRKTVMVVIVLESTDWCILRAASLLGVRTCCFSARNLRARARFSVGRLAAAGHFGSFGWYKVCSRRFFAVGFGFTALAMILPFHALAGADGLGTACAFFRGGTNCVVTHICH